MSDSIDANLLRYASDTSSPEHSRVHQIVQSRATDPDLLCLTWPTLMAYQRMATHPSIFSNPLDPADAWNNIRSLLALPRTRIVTEEDGITEDYLSATDGIATRGNRVPDAHVATILRQHGVGRIYTADADFRKFRFLEAVNPLL